MKILTVVSLLLAPAFTVSVRERLQLSSRQDDYGVTEADYPVLEEELPYEVVNDHPDMEYDDVPMEEDYPVEDDGVEMHDDYGYHDDAPADDYEYPAVSPPTEEPHPVKCLEIRYVYLPGEEGP